MLVAILRPKNEKNVIALITLDVMSFIAYVLCPFYVIISFIEGQLNFVIPVAASALVAHFIIKPAIRKSISD